MKKKTYGGAPLDPTPIEDEKDDTLDELAALAKDIEFPPLDEAQTPVKSGYKSGFEDVDSGQEEDEKVDTLDELAALAKGVEFPPIEQAQPDDQIRDQSGYHSGFEDEDSEKVEEAEPLQSDMNIKQIIQELENLPVSTEDRATIIRELEESLEPLAQKTTKEPQTELEALDFKEFEMSTTDPKHLQDHELEPLSMPSEDPFADLRFDPEDVFLPEDGAPLPPVIPKAFEQAAAAKDKADDKSKGNESSDDEKADLGENKTLRNQ